MGNPKHDDLEEKYYEIDFYRLPARPFIVQRNKRKKRKEHLLNYNRISRYLNKGGVNAGLEISAVIRIRIITADVFNICNVSDSGSGCYSSGGGSGTSGVNDSLYRVRDNDFYKITTTQSFYLDLISNETQYLQLVFLKGYYLEEKV
ncbi:hypothetical protein V1477_002941 [Vespula maculifrons]|uniref:Uncharacterized protein n=1 Tax=Vespula maculifrons TaxID=7453 RepID=A0ABD2CUN6_VESMC